MNTQKLEQVPIDKLVPYARNARTHSKEQIAQLRASLREFGFVSPAVIDADYNILVGHGRITAAREEGYETVPCVFAENLTEAQKRAYILADNQLALNAGWDEEMLSVELSDLQDQSFDLSLLGFDAGELDKLLGTGNEKDIADDDFDLTAALRRLLRGARRHLDSRQASCYVWRRHLAGRCGKAHERQESKPRPDRSALRRIFQSLGRSHDPERLSQGRRILQVPAGSF